MLITFLCKRHWVLKRLAIFNEVILINLNYKEQSINNFMSDQRPDTHTTFPTYIQENVGLTCDLIFSWIKRNCTTTAFVTLPLSVLGRNPLLFLENHIRYRKSEFSAFTWKILGLLKPVQLHSNEYQFHWNTC